MNNISERRAFVHELFVLFSLLIVITISSYIVVELLTSEKVASCLKATNFSF